MTNDCEHPDEDQMIAVCSCVYCTACDKVIARCVEHETDNFDVDEFDDE